MEESCTFLRFLRIMAVLVLALACKNEESVNSTDLLPEKIESKVPGCDSKGNASEKNPHCQTPAPTSTPSLTPSPTATPQAVSYTSISTGASHACAVTGSGRAQCWGDNSFGKLGDGTLLNVSRKNRYR